MFKIFCFGDENLLKATIFNAIKTLIMSHFPNDGKLNFEETDFEIFIYLESEALLSFLTSHWSFAAARPRQAASDAIYPGSHLNTLCPGNSPLH